MTSQNEANSSQNPAGTRLCWFCEANPADPNAKVTIHLEKTLKSNTDWSGATTTESREYKKTETTILRCAACHTGQKRSKAITKLLSYSGTILALIIFWLGLVFMPPEISTIAGIAYSLILMMLMVIVPFFIYMKAGKYLWERGTISWPTPGKYPEENKAVASYRSQGWRIVSFGDSPELHTSFLTTIPHEPDAPEPEHTVTLRGNDTKHR